ncbi:MULTISPECIES: NAD(P)H-hydrate dehydratase [Butyricimonas]|uniref:NAD(P)H-hydrate dehydratase n=1 Tax=Butyricimonas TaxID=574697 RepID=UPI0009F4DF23|nr:MULTISPECIES: NAD(P)H-hydrate dehydratase [Butyricimonas]
MKNEYMKIFKASEVSELDKYTIDYESITSLDLMERAACALTEKLLIFFSRDHIFNILAGCGNNAGDGYAVARLLNEMEMTVKVFDLCPEKQLSPDCAVNRELFIQDGGTCIEVEKVEDFVPDEGCVIIDAIFGAGLNRPVTGFLGDIIRKVNALPHRVVAIDIPSGLFGEDNGKNDGAIVKADYTFTFQFPKLAFMFPENGKYVGRVEVLDIRLHPGILRERESPWYYLTGEAVASRLLVPDKFSHKGTLGNTLLIAGSPEMPGAAVLAARGAIRSGTGLLTVHVPSSLKQMIHVAVPEALVEVDRSDYSFSGVDDLRGVQAVGVGPGLGMAPAAREGVRQLLKEWKGKMVLDADALNLIAADADLLDLVPRGAILTPHPREFERLAGKSENDFDRLNKLSTFASLHQVYVVLKGACTVIASPEGNCYFNTTGNPGMAKGGAGDVLTGIIAALLASGHEPLDAAVIGVYVHGKAGDLAAEEQGMRGVRAGDIADKLGLVWKMMETCNIAK